MTCIHTGAHIFVVSHHVYARCDAHQFGKTYIFRVVVTDFEPLEEVIHFTVKDFDEWFDRSLSDSRRGVSTLIAREVEEHGYEGWPLEDWEGDDHD